MLFRVSGPGRTRRLRARAALPPPATTRSAVRIAAYAYSVSSSWHSLGLAARSFSTTELQYRNCNCMRFVTLASVGLACGMAWRSFMTGKQISERTTLQSNRPPHQTDRHASWSPGN
jgi:hypothetical protein